MQAAKQEIRRLIEEQLGCTAPNEQVASGSGAVSGKGSGNDASAGAEALVDTGIHGVKLFKVTNAMRCAPAIYEPAVIAIVSGTKEAILDGQCFGYDSEQYMCCTMSMPVEAGTPLASPEAPLLGVYISLDTKVMTELVIELASTATINRKPKS